MTTWTPERRAAQSARIRAHRPWEKSTGPRTASGKARAAQNARRSGSYSATMMDYSKMISLIAQFRRDHERAHALGLSERPAICRLHKGLREMGDRIYKRSGLIPRWRTLTLQYNEAIAPPAAAPRSAAIPLSAPLPGKTGCKPIRTKKFPHIPERTVTSGAFHWLSACCSLYNSDINTQEHNKNTGTDPPCSPKSRSAAPVNITSRISMSISPATNWW
ncbi:MAG: hypothetical protein KJ667_00815 [Alphaproteobacteria bacterium]|nr:hypothetical protein [Alphaproteobacteria bacterium]